ncbi:helicase-related protein [Spirosoma radiotolerans]|uniref:Helicase n=1 Tax=Spirosoma radiotolerans TaxID=1379870 RepID=A0A0E3V8Z0_9BACT|nr:helicase-related protein [Spirosoma radiotolerans]AKD56691.1 hypothetical protein SD10_19075 [Spirosoma radiotolerans]
MNQPDKPTLNYDLETGELMSGVGPGTVETFLKQYYGRAKKRIRIASAYFTVKGYDIGTQYLTNRSVQFQILVGAEEGASVQSSIIKEVERELTSCKEDLWNAVYQLVQRMESNQFIIRDAREMVDARGIEIAFHCKYYICDDSILWHGSGNYTGRGLRTTIEQASLIRSAPEVKSFVERFEKDMRGAKDLLPDLLERLRKWLDLVPPFHVYLLILHKLNKLFEREAEPGLDLPVYYQQAIIMRAVEQVKLYDGSIIIAATGLGKTVIGAEIAYQLRLFKRAKHVILIAPQAVHDEWKRHIKAREFFFEPISIETLFKDSVDETPTHHKTHQLELILKQAGPQTLIIIDEGHAYRNQLKQQWIAFESKRRRKKQPKGSLVYKRLLPVVNQKGAAMILLTATPYGTDTQNLNSLLRLLPERRIDPLFNEPTAWRVESLDDFMKLPVVSVLGLHDVLKLARTRNNVDEKGRLFVQFGEERRYLPRVIQVNKVSYELPLASELRKAFDADCFSHATPTLTDHYDEEARKFKTGAVDTADKNFILSWLSSPSAVRESIRKNLYTIGTNDPVDGTGQQIPIWANDLSANPSFPTKDEQDKLGYTAKMLRSWYERNQVLRSSLESLKEFQPDDKVHKLQAIIQQHCLERKEKVIVFVERLCTATFIEIALQNYFGGTVKIGCTVHVTSSKYELKKPKYRRELLKQFSPKSHRHSTKHELDILICTDADGVGVNLQDANVVVNYDPTEGADTLFQRAGRVLRFTNDPDRIVYLYTFIPANIQQQTRSEAWKRIRNTFDRMMKRHTKSRHILGLDVMASETVKTIDLNDPQIEERLASEFDYYETTGTNQSHPLFHHVAMREQYSDLAKTLPEGIHSAMYYGQEERVVVLIDINSEKRLLLFNTATQLFEHEHDSLEILDLIKCEEATERALVNPATVESEAKNAVRLWCEQTSTDLDNVREICAVYLLPKPKNRSVRAIIAGVINYRQRKWNKAKQ